jgi:hypothetical protein
VKNHFSGWLTLLAENVTGSMVLEWLATMEKTHRHDPGGRLYQAIARPVSHGLA